MKNKKKWVRGKNITISPKAHEIFIKKTVKDTPRKYIRQIVNELLGLPIDE